MVPSSFSGSSNGISVAPQRLLETALASNFVSHERLGQHFRKDKSNPTAAQHPRDFVARYPDLDAPSHPPQRNPKSKTIGNYALDAKHIFITNVSK
jgi:hypothetical protein